MNTNFETCFPKYEDYIDSIVAFVDVLGFDSRARNIKSENDFKKVAATLFVLNEIAKTINEEKTSLANFKIIAISDSLIITAPFHDKSRSTMSLTVMLHMLQYQLLKGFKTLIRGYIIRGPVYHSENIIFGKGYSEAYEKERAINYPPRVVIDPSLIEEAKSIIQNNSFYDHILNYLVRDSLDTHYFIDYLKPVGARAAIPIKDSITERSKIKEFVQSQLNTFKDKENIFEKYNWLNNYILSTEHYFNLEKTT